MIMIDIQNNSKYVIITGCASGIGQSTTLKYLNMGYYVIGIDIEKCIYDGQFRYFHCDISDSKSVEALFVAIKKEYKAINYLIHSAGVFFHQSRAMISEMSIDEWNNVLRINLTGTMLVVKNSLDLLKNAEGDKAVVLISSDQAVKPRAKNCAYAASKGAIDTFAKACAVELLPYGIRVNSVNPASVQTNFIKRLFENESQMIETFKKQNEKMPLGIIKSEEVAEAAYFLGSTHSLKITGQSILIDSGLYL